MPDPPAVRDLGVADLEAAVSLSASVGWNQVEADWRVFLDHGHALAVDDESGRLAATAAVLPFGPDLAWISMVIVRADQRGRGLATMLLERCVAEIRTSGRVAGLDATPAGRPVYRRLGFEDGAGLTRWRRPAKTPLVPAAPAPGIRVRPVEPGDWPAIEALDRTAFGASRAFLLRELAARSPTASSVAIGPDGRLAGFVLGRDGRSATQVGPLVAETDAAGLALATHAAASLATPLTIDVADRFAGLTLWLSASGFAIERPFTRMYLGRGEPFGDPSLVVAIAGPELA